MIGKKANRIAELEARLDVAQRPREDGLSADDATALRTELSTTRMRLNHAKEQLNLRQGQIDQLIKRLTEYADAGIANGERADQAEAKLTAVRKAAHNLADGTEAGARAAHAVLDALDDPQPAAEAEVAS